jgi:hypothetical protein
MLNRLGILKEVIYYLDMHQQRRTNELEIFSNLNTNPVIITGQVH